MIYLDNAATTPMLPEVIQVMQKSMAENFGNPSSTHQAGRKAKSAIELARKNIAQHFNVEASQIVFASSGTEANNFVLQNAVTNLGVKTIITTKIEHHAVLNTVVFLEKYHSVNVVYINVDRFGSVDLIHLKQVLMNTDGKKLVSLMMVNNEIGNVLPVDEVCELCNVHNALFHSDTVQAIGHYNIDLKKTPMDFIVASAHKFHGPKGIGFLYFKKGMQLQPLLYGGGQEKGLRSSTENVNAILGMDEALKMAYMNLEKDKKYLIDLKRYFISQLQKEYTDIKFNGLSFDVVESSYTILNVRFPFSDKLFLFNLDMNGVAASTGSACQSGANKISHVLKEILADNELQKTSIRFSLSKLTTKKEIDCVIRVLKHENTKTRNINFKAF